MHPYFERQNAPCPALHEKLLSMGGVAASPSFHVNLRDAFLDDLLRGGRLYVPEKTRRIRGRRGYCHYNAVDYIQARRRGDPWLMTGWALGDEGHWYQHSWVWENGKTLETTPYSAVKYFGVGVWNYDCFRDALQRDYEEEAQAVALSRAENEEAWAAAAALFRAE